MRSIRQLGEGGKRRNINETKKPKSTQLADNTQGSVTGKTKEISTKNTGIKILITNQINWNSKQKKHTQKKETSNYKLQPTLKLDKKQMKKMQKTKNKNKPLKSPTSARGKVKERVLRGMFDGD